METGRPFGQKNRQKEIEKWRPRDAQRPPKRTKYDDKFPLNTCKWILLRKILALYSGRYGSR